MVFGRSLRLAGLRPNCYLTELSRLVVHPGFGDFGRGIRGVAALHEEATQSEGSEN